MTPTVKQRSSYVHGIIPDAENREPHDFYPTPPEGTRGLLRVEKFERGIWEPACGDGAMARELVAAGYKVTATDLIDRGYGTPGRDFLAERALLEQDIVTNPPFTLIEEFAHHACALGAKKVCLMARLAWLEGSGRHMRLFKRRPPARVWVFPHRVRFARGGRGKAGGMIAFCWLVWDRTARHGTQLGWIRRDIFS